MVLPRIVKSDHPLAVRERGRELRLEVLGGCDVLMPEERLLPVATRLGRRQHLGRQRSPALDLAAIVVADRQPRARHAEPSCVSRRCAHRRRPLVGGRRFRARVAARGDERGPERELEAQLACVPLRTCRLHVEEADRLPQLPGRLPVRRARLRLLACVAVARDRVVDPSRRFRMPRHHLGLGGHPLGEPLTQQVDHPPGFSTPQAGHPGASRWPQAPQNFMPAWLSLPQCGQVMRGVFWRALTIRVV